MNDDLAITLYQKISESEKDQEMVQWRASALSQCPRSQFLKRKGVKSLRSMTGARILRNQAGHHAEAAIREHLKSIYPDLVSNVRFRNEELDCGGELDNYSPERKEIIEIKTIGVRAPRYKRVDESRHHLKDDCPYLHHEIQQHLYVKMMQHDTTFQKTDWVDTDMFKKVSPGDAYIPCQLKEVEKITYLYITLEGLLISYTTPVKPEVMDMVDKRLDLLNECWKADKLPPCFCQRIDHPLFNSNMQYCDFRPSQPKKDTPDDNCCSAKLLKTLEVV